QFFSTSRMKEQNKKVGRILRLGISQPPANSQEARSHRLQNEAEASGPCESVRKFFEKLPREQVHAARFDGLHNRKRYRGSYHENRQCEHYGPASHSHALGPGKRDSLGAIRVISPRTRYPAARA